MKKYQNHIIIGIIVTLLIWGGYAFIKSQSLYYEAERVAQKSLILQKSFTHTYWGETFTCRFYQGEYQNVAVVKYKKEEVRKVDYNKSKILGEYAGEKTKEFLRGWIKGKKKESRFKSE